MPGQALNSGSLMRSSGSNQKRRHEGPQGGLGPRGHGSERSARTSSFIGRQGPFESRMTAMASLMRGFETTKDSLSDYEDGPGRDLITRTLKQQAETLAAEMQSLLEEFNASNADIYSNFYVPAVVNHSHDERETVGRVGGESGFELAGHTFQFS